MKNMFVILALGFALFAATATAAVMFPHAAIADCGTTGC
jgi:hypothetical protein